MQQISCGKFQANKGSVENLTLKNLHNRRSYQDS